MWQPIDTAPKDGTKILTCALQSYPDSINVCWWKSDWFEGEFWQDDRDSEPAPTHWLPLPETPKQ